MSADPPPPPASIGHEGRTAARNVHRCSRCMAELYAADRGYGSTALACPTHGFDRQTVSVPAWVENAAKSHPDEARRYVEFLVGVDSDVEQDATSDDAEDWATRIKRKLRETEAALEVERRRVQLRRFAADFYGNRDQWLDDRRVNGFPGFHGAQIAENALAALASLDAGEPEPTSVASEAANANADEVQVDPNPSKLLEFDAWLSFAPDPAEILPAFRKAFGTDTSAGGGTSEVGCAPPPADHVDSNASEHGCNPCINAALSPVGEREPTYEEDREFGECGVESPGPVPVEGERPYAPHFEKATPAQAAQAQAFRAAGSNREALIERLRKRADFIAPVDSHGDVELFREAADALAGVVPPGSDDERGRLIVEGLRRAAKDIVTPNWRVDVEGLADLLVQAADHIASGPHSGLPVEPSGEAVGRLEGLPADPRQGWACGGCGHPFPLDSQPTVCPECDESAGVTKRWLTNAEVKARKAAERGPSQEAVRAACVAMNAAEGEWDDGEPGCVCDGKGVIVPPENLPLESKFCVCRYGRLLAESDDLAMDLNEARAEVERLKADVQTAIEGSNRRGEIIDRLRASKPLSTDLLRNPPDELKAAVAGWVGDSLYTAGRLLTDLAATLDGWDAFVGASESYSSSSLDEQSDDGRTLTNGHMAVRLDVVDRLWWRPLPDGEWVHLGDLIAAASPSPAVGLTVEDRDCRQPGPSAGCYCTLVAGHPGAHSSRHFSGLNWARDEHVVAHIRRVLRAHERDLEDLGQPTKNEMRYLIEHIRELVAVSGGPDQNGGDDDEH